jgi:uncharacterized protein YlzI (FlbEa/FlbD family)
LIATVEAHPDTVIRLTTGSLLIVGESPADVTDRMRTRGCAALLADAGG